MRAAQLSLAARCWGAEVAVGAALRGARAAAGRGGGGGASAGSGGGASSPTDPLGAAMAIAPGDAAVAPGGVRDAAAWQKTCEPA